MARMQSRADQTKEVARLQQRHSTLSERVAKYEMRLSLTAREQLQLLQLKKEKLATKDALAQYALS